MQGAATNLGINIEMVYAARRSPIVLRKIGTQVLNRKIKPDYLILINDRDVVPKLMKAADTKGITTVLFNGDISTEKRRAFKSGPKALKHWIGGIFPDEEQAGYLLAKTLVDKAREKSLYDKSSATPKIKVIGLNGARRSLTTEQRERGLKKFVQENNDVELVRAVHAYWKKEKAETIVNHLLKTYPNTTVIWSASDLMSLGGVEGAKLNGRNAGSDILTCGIDWIFEVFEKIQDKTLSCTVGGHIFDGAWLMVLLLDHYNGLTDHFIDEKTQFSSIDINSLSKFEHLMNKDLWKKINYKQFSKVHSKNAPDKFGSNLLLNLY